MFEMVSNLLKILTIILINSFMASKCVGILYNFVKVLYWKNRLV